MSSEHLETNLLFNSMAESMGIPRRYFPTIGDYKPRSANVSIQPIQTLKNYLYNPPESSPDNYGMTTGTLPLQVPVSPSMTKEEMDQILEVFRNRYEQKSKLHPLYAPPVKAKPKSKIRRVRVVDVNFSEEEE
jgi:hypothetical protein